MLNIKDADIILFKQAVFQVDIDESKNRYALLDLRKGDDFYNFRSYKRLCECINNLINQGGTFHRPELA